MNIKILDKAIIIDDDGITERLDFVDSIDQSKLNGYVQELKEQLAIKKQQKAYYETLRDIEIKIPYHQLRKSEYPAIEEQLDMLYWDLLNGTDKWRDKITEIKTKYPKPTLK